MKEKEARHAFHEEKSLLPNSTNVDEMLQIIFIISER